MNQIYVLMQRRDLLRERAKRGRDGIELDLLERYRVRLRRLIQEVIRAEEAELERLHTERDELWTRSREEQ